MRGGRLGPEKGRRRRTMADAPMQPELMKLVDTLLSVPAEISLDEVCAGVKYDLGIADDQEVKCLTLEAVHELLRRGALVEFDSEAAPKQRPEMTSDEIVALIDQEWEATGEMPTLPGEICLFAWTPEAMEAYARQRRPAGERS